MQPRIPVAALIFLASYLPLAMILALQDLDLTILTQPICRGWRLESSLGELRSPLEAPWDGDGPGGGLPTLPARDGVRPEQGAAADADRHQVVQGSYRLEIHGDLAVLIDDDKAGSVSGTGLMSTLGAGRRSQCWHRSLEPRPITGADATLGPTASSKPHSPTTPSRGSDFQLSWTPASRGGPILAPGGSPRILKDGGFNAPSPGVGDTGSASV